MSGLVSRAAFASLALAGALGLASTASAQNYGGPRYGCACLNNETGTKINFRYQFGSQPMKSATMGANARQWICYDYGNGPRTSPPLNFQLDVDMTKGSAWTTYALTRIQSTAKSCAAIGKVGQYGVRYRANTNLSLIHI